MAIFSFYLIFVAYAFLFFYILRKKPTVLGLDSLSYFNLTYCLLFLASRYFLDSPMTISDIAIGMLLILPPIIFKEYLIVFAFSHAFFDDVAKESSRKLLIDYKKEGDLMYVVTTKETEIRMCLYPLLSKTAILSYKGPPIGKKIQVYKDLLRKSFYGALPTITINLRK